MATSLLNKVQQTRLDSAEISAATRTIYECVLQESACLDGGNFEVFHPLDLRTMFDLYDQKFFDGLCRRELGDSPLNFKISPRMTRAAGKTARAERRNPIHGVSDRRYEISVSSTLLFQTFCGEEREVTVSGLVCHDRLEAMQRVMEHEILHLIEMLLWEKSSCAAPRFQSMAKRFFGHTLHTHNLITPREKAWTEHGIRQGDQVRFRLDGRHYTGRVNRITKRATVLVEDAQGERYSDGKRYAKFYVPLGMLEKL
jgi:hypothetical protein